MSDIVDYETRRQVREKIATLASDLNLARRERERLDSIERRERELNGWFHRVAALVDALESSARWFGSYEEHLEDFAEIRSLMLRSRNTEVRRFRELTSPR